MLEDLIYFLFTAFLFITYLVAKYKDNNPFELSNFIKMIITVSILFHVYPTLKIVHKLIFGYSPSTEYTFSKKVKFFFNMLNVLLIIDILANMFTLFWFCNTIRAIDNNYHKFVALGIYISLVLQAYTSIMRQRAINYVYRGPSDIIRIILPNLVILIAAAITYKFMMKGDGNNYNIGSFVSGVAFLMVQLASVFMQRYPSRVGDYCVTNFGLFCWLQNMVPLVYMGFGTYKMKTIKIT